jgi:hypothetical protein
MGVFQPMRNPYRYWQILACIVSMMIVMDVRIIEQENRNAVMQWQLILIKSGGY